MSNFIKITFPDIDYESEVRVAVEHIANDPDLMKEGFLRKITLNTKPISDIVFGCYCIRQAVMGRFVNHKTHYYIDDNIEVTYHQKMPEATNQDVQFVINTKTGEITMTDWDSLS